VLQNIRLDRYVAEHLKLLTRSQIKTRSLTARLNGKEVKNSHKVKSGDSIELRWKEPEPENVIPEDLPLQVIYEDRRVVVINKAQGMVVYPGAGNRRGTLANALLFRRLRQGGLDAGETFRPGIVHRLDKDTSGVIIAAYDTEALTVLAEQFKARTVRKSYAAVVRGIIAEPAGRIETRITRDRRNRKRFMVSAEQGKTALTFYRVVRSWGGYSVVLLRPKTGRTHQLRVHLRHLGHPILGDPLYGLRDLRFPTVPLMLHAKRLTLRLPNEQTPRTFKAPFPPAFRELLKLLNPERQVFHSRFSAVPKDFQ
jgi:23S rRNA pseudouridine1911/1915/1917 synthase